MPVWHRSGLRNATRTLSLLCTTLCRFFIWLASRHGYHVVGPWHLQQRSRWRDKCNTCMQCRVDNPEKELLFERHAYWA